MGAKRASTWNPATPDGNLKVLFAAADHREQVVTRRAWMSATFKRMKFKGKTDARAREMVCLHLPRGSGPRDRDGVTTFSADELKACKKTYSESSLEPVKRVQKNIYDMREQRRNL